MTHRTPKKSDQIKENPLKEYRIRVDGYLNAFEVKGDEIEITDTGVLKILVYDPLDRMGDCTVACFREWDWVVDATIEFEEMASDD